MAICHYDNDENMTKVPYYVIKDTDYQAHKNSLDNVNLVTYLDNLE